MRNLVFLFIVLSLMLSCGIRTNLTGNIVGEYRMKDSLYGAYVRINADSTYHVKLPSTMETSKFAHLEHTGTWTYQPGFLVLTGDDKQDTSGVYDIFESISGNIHKDTVVFDIVTDADSLLRALIGEQSDSLLPIGSIGTLRLSNVGIVVTKLRRHISVKWRISERRWFMVKDAGGFYPPYLIKNPNSNHFKIIMDADAPLLGFEYGEFFMEEYVLIDGDSIVLDNRFTLKRVN